MARAQSTDFYQAFRYQVAELGPASFLDPAASFATVTVPEITIEAAEYKEGTWTWKRKYPGPATVGDVTLQRGVAKADSKFWDWGLSALNGAAYRADLSIRHLHKDDVVGLTDYSNAAASREYHLKEAFPIRVKPGGDLDANSSEVSLQEMDLSVESMELVLN